MATIKHTKKLVEEIAVIGIACRFPGAENYQQFWTNLVEKRNSITEIPADRWDWQAYYGDPQSGAKTNSKWGGFLDGVDLLMLHFLKYLPGKQNSWTLNSA